MLFFQIFFSAGILSFIVAQIIAFFPILQIWILDYLGLVENETLLNSLFVINLFVYALVEEWAKYFSAIFWWKKHHQIVSKKLILYIIASASGLAIFEKMLLIFLMMQNGDLENIPWVASTSLFLEAVVLHSINTVLLYPFIRTSSIKNSRLYLYIGLTLITLVHTFHNYLIIQSI